MTAQTEEPAVQRVLLARRLQHDRLLLFAQSLAILRGMKKIVALLCLASAPALAAGNYAECILDKMPGVQNDAVALAISRTCLAEHPGGINAVEQGSGRSEWFGYNSGNECVIKKGEKVASRVGGNLLTGACNKLYDPDGPWLDYQKSNH